MCDLSLSLVSFWFEMKPLVTQQRVLTWFCLCPFPDGTSNWQKLKYIFFSAILITNEISSISSSSAHCLRYISVDLKESLFSLFQIAASSSVLYQIIIALFSKHRIFGIIQGLNRIYDESKELFNCCTLHSTTMCQD